MVGPSRDSRLKINFVRDMTLLAASQCRGTSSVTVLRKDGLIFLEDIMPGTGEESEEA